MQEPFAQPPTAAHSAPPAQPRLFQNRIKVGRQATAAFAMAAFGFLLTIFGFLASLLSASADSPSSQFIRTGSTVIPCMIFIFSLGYAITLVTKPVRLVVDDLGLTLEGLLSRRRLEWCAIARLRRGKLEGLAATYIQAHNKNISMQTLELLDDRGKKIAEIPASFEDFDTLAAEIQARSTAARGADTFSPQSQAADLVRRQNRSRITTTLLGLFLLAIGLACAFTVLPEAFHERKLYREGTPAVATVTRHFAVRASSQIEYQWTDPDGAQHTRVARLRDAAWDELAEGDSVPIFVHPDLPGLSRLVVETPQHGNFDLLALSVGMPALILAGLGALLMSALRIAEIKLVNSRLKLIRVGDPEPETPGASATPATPGAAPAPPRPFVAPPPIPPAAAPAPRSPLPDAPEPSPIPGRAALPRPDALPAGIKALGILNILYGLFIVLINATRLLLVLAVGQAGGVVEFSGPEDYAIEVDRDLLYFAGLEQLVMIALGLALAGAGAGLLLRWRWTRLASVLVGLIMVAVGLYYLFAFATVDLLDPADMTEDMKFAARFVRTAGFLAVIALTIYPLTMALLLARKSTKQTFNASRP